eukprot:13258967-Alexandrium_andersonii.AAC.1
MFTSIAVSISVGRFGMSAGTAAERVARSLGDQFAGRSWVRIPEWPSGGGSARGSGLTGAPESKNGGAPRTRLC